MRPRDRDAHTRHSSLVDCVERGDGRSPRGRRPRNVHGVPIARTPPRSASRRTDREGIVRGRNELTVRRTGAPAANPASPHGTGIRAPRANVDGDDETTTPPVRDDVARRQALAHGRIAPRPSSDATWVARARPRGRGPPRRGFIQRWRRLPTHDLTTPTSVTIIPPTSSNALASGVEHESLRAQSSKTGEAPSADGSDTRSDRHGARVGLGSARRTKRFARLTERLASRLVAARPRRPSLVASREQRSPLVPDEHARPGRATRPHIHNHFSTQHLLATIHKEKY